MSIINQNFTGLKGPRGDESTVSSGIFANITLGAWATSRGRSYLDNICCDSFVTASGVGTDSLVGWNPLGYCERLYTSSGVITKISPSDTNMYKDIGLIVSNGLQPSYSSSLKNSVERIDINLCPSARENSMMAYSADDEAMFLFGGNDGLRKSDLWKYNVNQRTWVNITPAGSSPPGRDNHTMIYNSQSRNLVVFGGMTSSGLVNDTWSYSIVSGTWSQLSPSGLAPGVRQSHSAVYDPLGNQMLIWGGLSSSTNFNETFQLSFVNNYWLNLSDTGYPTARNDHWAAFDTQTGSMVIYGGSAGTTLYGDLWLYNIESNLWVQRQSTTNTMWGHTLAADILKRSIIVVGGQSSTGLFMTDIMIYELDTGNFYNLITPYEFPLNSATAWDTINNKLYIFGGRNSLANLVNTFIKYTYYEHTFEKTLQVSYTTDSSNFLTKGWSHLDYIRVNQQNKGLSVLTYAFSFDQRNSWKIYSTTSGWCSIAQNNSGNWQYRNLGGGWTTSSGNDMHSALNQAFSLSSNKWGWLDTDLSRQEISAIPNMYSNVNPAPYMASASSENNQTTNAAWNAFSTSTTSWVNTTTSTNQWLQINTGTPFVPYAWRWKTSNTSYAPKRFKLQGFRSSSGSWDDLDIVYAASDYSQMAAGVFTPWFPLTTASGYSIYRMFINSGYHATYVYIDQLEISKKQIRPALIGRAAWESSGGFIPGITKSINVAMGFDAVDYIPSVQSMEACYMTSDTNMVLISHAWDASQINPVSAQFLMKYKLVDPVVLDTDLKVWVSMDDGANYEQISGLFVMNIVDDFYYVAGAKSNLTPRNAKKMRTKVTVDNYKNIQIYGISLGVDY
jgi:hypothetical protein